MQATAAYFVYAASLSSPIVISALFIFGASSFGNFEDEITRFLPVTNVFQIVGIDSDFLDTLAELVAFVYELAEDGIEAVVDLVLQIPKNINSELEAQVITQFAGGVITLFFLVS